MSIGNNVPTWSLTQQGTIDHINEPFVELFAKILNMESIPLVLSVSYADNVTDVDSSYKSKVEEYLLKLSLRGVSVLFASGDGGVCGTFDCHECSQEVLMFPTMSQ